MIKMMVGLIAVLTAGCGPLDQRRPFPAPGDEVSGLSAATPGRTKLGLHTGLCFGNPPGCNRRSAVEYVRAVKPPLIKVLDGFGEPELAAIKKASPGTKILGRIYYPDNEFDYVRDPVGEARRWWNLSLGRITASANDAIDYWEAVNEPQVGTLEQMRLYARFEKTRIELMAQHKKRRKACIGNFAQGTPHIDIARSETAFWEAFLPAIDAALGQTGARGILCVHEYSLKTNFSDGSMLNWHIGRYRQVYQYLRSAGRGGIQLAITEFGIDADGVAGGWKIQFAGTEQEKARAYVGQMLWFDRNYLQADPYVLGAAIFQHGIPPGWERYDIEPALGVLAQRIKNGT